MTDTELVKAAQEMLKYAYAPYSKFLVGAALLGRDGRVFTGCNVENASYGATNCAERTAVFKAISEGCREFLAIAIVSSSGKYTYPCGICRQVLSEFCGEDFDIIVANDKESKQFTLGELLPNGFTL